jgi:hypothetical protein
MTPIVLKLEEVVKQYAFKVKQQQQAINLDHEVEHSYWPHPAKTISIQEVENYEAKVLTPMELSSKKGLGRG